MLKGLPEENSMMGAKVQPLKNLRAKPLPPELSGLIDAAEDEAVALIK